MARVALLGGAYQARSGIANAQEAVNVYPELNPQDSPVPVTHYPRPGLLNVGQFPDQTTVRGLYTAGNGQLYGVCGQSVYSIDQNANLVKLGTLQTAGLSTLVSLVDNGTTVVIVDGSPLGSQITLGTNAFAAIVDPTGIFVGGIRADVLDGFLVFPQPASNQFYATHDLSVIFDPLYVGAKTDYNDQIVTLGVWHRELWLLGRVTSEVWFDAGNPQLPFAEIPGAFVRTGIAAARSLATHGRFACWVSLDLDGQGIVVKGENYDVERISNHGMEQEIQGYPTIADATAFFWQLGGHTFYQLTFPTADVTWVYDITTKQWHKSLWTDGNGVMHRNRANCHAFAYGQHWLGDFENGVLYQSSANVSTDAGSVISCRRSFPHLSYLQGQSKLGYDPGDTGRRIQFKQFLADMEVGDAAPGTTVNVYLSWSDDRGKTFGTKVPLAAAGGAYLTSLQARNLGVSRDRVWKLEWQASDFRSLQGAWVDSKLMAT